MATTLDALKKKYASQYSNLAAAMQTTKDPIAYNELKTLRDDKLVGMKASGDANYTKYANQIIAPVTSTPDPDRELARKIRDGVIPTNEIDGRVKALGSGIAYTPAPVVQQQIPVPAPVVAPVSTTDILIQSLLGKLLGQEQNKADFGSYMSTWKPGMSQNEYVNTAANAIGAAENTKYDNNTASIKQRVANILSGLNNKMATLPGKYQGAYDANTQNAYDQSENIKLIMARRGLLTSGIDVGNQKQTENTYNASAQGITAQLNADKTDLTNQMNMANSDAESEITAAERERQNAIASGKASAQRDYIDYIDKQKQFASDNFWKGANYNLDAQKVQSDLIGMAGNYSQGQQQLSQDAQQFNAKIQQDAQQFAASNDLDWANLNSSEKQFYTKLAQEQTQFTSQMTQDATQFAATQGYNYNKLKQDGRQFDVQMGYNYAELSAQNIRAANSLANSLATANISAGMTADGKWTAKFEEEKRQFDEGYKLQLRDMDLKTKDFYQRENDRVDGMLGQLLDVHFTTTDETKKRELASQIIASVKSSSLQESTKNEKYKMISEITGVRIPTYPTRGYAP